MAKWFKGYMYPFLCGYTANKSPSHSTSSHTAAVGNTAMEACHTFGETMLSCAHCSNIDGVSCYLNCFLQCLLKSHY